MASRTAGSAGVKNVGRRVSYNVATPWPAPASMIGMPPRVNSQRAVSLISTG
jgi:hypothetical protein